jgi:hypothetical protein
VTTDIIVSYEVMFSVITFLAKLSLMPVGLYKDKFYSGFTDMSGIPVSPHSTYSAQNVVQGLYAISQFVLHAHVI